MPVRDQGHVTLKRLELLDEPIGPRGNLVREFPIGHPSAKIFHPLGEVWLDLCERTEAGELPGPQGPLARAAQCPEK